MFARNRASLGTRKSRPRRNQAFLAVEALEDRCVLAVVAEFGAGITAGASPNALVTGADGNLWFTEFGGDRVGRITPAGVVTEFLLTPGSGPVGIVSGPDGDLWFTESTGDHIGRLNPLAGSNLAIQASLSEFLLPSEGKDVRGIAAGPDGALWFTEAATDAIGRITTAGVVTGEFQVPGPGSKPLGITAGPDGALWFTEVASGEIGRITTAGAVTNEFVLPVHGSSPHSITTGPDGALWFTEVLGPRIGRLTTAGALTEILLPANTAPQGITTGPDGALYFTESARDRIGRVTLSGNVVELGAAITPGSAPAGITAGPDGNLWFAEFGGNRIGRISPLSTFTVAAAGPIVAVLNPDFTTRFQFLPYSPAYTGGVLVAVGDVNGDGIPDIITGTGIGGGSHIKVFSGLDFSLLRSFVAFNPEFAGGITLAAGDVDGDGFSDIIAGTATGGGQVKVFSGRTGELIRSFLAYNPEFGAGITVAAGDVDGDGRADIITGTCPGGTHVKVFSGRTGELIRSFVAYDLSFPGGVFVASGDVNGDGIADLITGVGPGGGSHVEVFDGATGVLLQSFTAFPPAYIGGVSVAAVDFDGDGRADVVTAPVMSAGAQVEVFKGGDPNNTLLFSGLVFSPAYAGGLFLGGTPPDPDAKFLAGGFVVPAPPGPNVGVAAFPPAGPATTISGLRRTIDDLYVFRSPADQLNTVLIMTLSPFAAATTPPVFDESLEYFFNVANRDLVGPAGRPAADIRFAAVFSSPDSQGSQIVSLLRPDAVGVVLSRGRTNTNLTGTGGIQFRAGLQDDPRFQDAAGLEQYFDGGPFPRPPGAATNFFGPSANVLALSLEVPNAALRGPNSDLLGVWASDELNGRQLDRAGRPFIDELLIPPVPRGPKTQANGNQAPDLRPLFNGSDPAGDRVTFTNAVVGILTNFYGRDPNTATTFASLFLPDLAVYQLGNPNGFGVFVFDPSGQFLGNGRRLGDDALDFELSLLTGGTINSDNVGDDNGQKVTDGSFDPVGGTFRAIAFPYIGKPNVPAQPLPGPQPPP